MDYDLVIKNGKIVTAVSTYKADVAIIGEKIVAIGDDLHGQKELDATGMLVTPGAVDIHVHLEMPIGNFTSTDDFFSGTQAAAFGGTTTIIDFVETQPEQTMVEAIAARRALADPKVVIDYGLHMTIGPNDIAKLEQLPTAYEAGCTSFKLYMAYGLRLHDGELLAALTAVKNTGGMPVVHAENWDIITQLIAENIAKGNTSSHYHPRSRPAQFEAEATRRVIEIADFVDTPIHIFHVSCAETVEQIALARQAGMPVTGETCPQYLFLTWDAYDAFGVEGTLPVCSPPIRSQTQQDALWRALQDGNLQLVTTDHCPFTKAEKATGLDNYSQIPGGVPSIEMRFASIFKGVQDGVLSLTEWVDLCCTTPANLMGLENKGHIAPGFDADIIIFDGEKEIILSNDSLHEIVDWTPYEGIQFKGWPKTTIVRGQVVVDDGQLQVKEGYGRFLRAQ